MKNNEQQLKGQQLANVKKSKKKPEILDHAPKPHGGNGQQLDPEINDLSP